MGQSDLWEQTKNESAMEADAKAEVYVDAMVASHNDSSFIIG